MLIFRSVIILFNNVVALPVLFGDVVARLSHEKSSTLQYDDVVVLNGPRAVVREYRVPANRRLLSPSSEWRADGQHLMKHTEIV